MEKSRKLSAKSSQKVHRSSSELIFKIVAYLFITLFALLCLYPLLFVFSSAVSAGEAIISGKVVAFPVGFQWNAFTAVFTNKRFWISYANTFFVTVYGTIYCRILSVFGAYALSKGRRPGQKLFNFLMVFTMWFAAGVIPRNLNYQQTKSVLGTRGISDQKWVIILAMGRAAYNVILLRNAFQSVPKEIEEAATVDGANDRQIRQKIYVPRSKATVAIVALFYGISRWNGYFWARKVVDNAYDLPLQVTIQSQISTIEQEIAENGAAIVNGYARQSIIYAMVVCAIIPILIIYPFIQKYFAAGVNLGGVKE